ncbi:hypothetical protein ACEPAF_6769 [Sanghuangporus sanghuang]
MTSLDAHAPLIQQWDGVFNGLKELASTTVKSNIELSRRASDLENELQVWKLARTNAIDEQKREKIQYEEEIKKLQKRISVLESMQESMVLCILDGDGNIFADHHLKAGLEGGREAARRLTRGIYSYLEENGYSGQSSRFTFWLSIYFNKKGLQETLVRSGVCTADQFEAFVVGISQASPRFLLVDVGYGKEAADSKIKEYLQTYTRFPQTLKVFFGGGHDNGYLPTLAALENERLLQRIVLLQGYHDTATELKALNLPTLNLDNLFRTVKLSGSLPTSQLATSPSTSVYDIPVFPPGLKPYNQPSYGSTPLSNNVPQVVKEQIDATLPLSKQKPPPCNEYYLLKRCPRKENCKYSHDYDLSLEHVSELAQIAKSTPCHATKNGFKCAFGAACIWGHTCPRGPKCYYYKQGKCRFKTAEAHLEAANGISAHSPSVSVHSLRGSVRSPDEFAQTSGSRTDVPDRFDPPPGLSKMDSLFGDALNLSLN